VKCEKHLLVQVPDTGSWSVETLHHRNTEMLECRNEKNTFWCRFRILGVGVSKHFTTGIPKCQNDEIRKTPFCAGFGYQELEVSKHFTIGMPKCQNVKMKKTPFGASFRYQELEVSRYVSTGMPKCRNVKM
jgi:hypothetical protein